MRLMQVFVYIVEVGYEGLLTHEKSIFDKMFIHKSSLPDCNIHHLNVIDA